MAIRPEQLQRISDDVVVVFPRQQSEGKFLISETHERVEALDLAIASLEASDNDLRSLEDLRAFLQSDAGNAMSSAELEAGLAIWLAGAAARKQLADLIATRTEVAARLAAAEALEIEPE